MDGGGYVQVQMDFLEACSAGDIKKTTALLSSGYIDSNFHHHVNGWSVSFVHHILYSIISLNFSFEISSKSQKFIYVVYVWT
ncbi:unnamed protein product [Anisakis simplex]|uniref:ANK_REP_REGION domain-containing protein n=1 Tax=Anisakis simplex TaxID=6269 RepID=A0A0M3JDJ5_ANISI|nr:unnamed protein product [Anisakis simplex]